MNWAERYCRSLQKESAFYYAEARNERTSRWMQVHFQKLSAELAKRARVSLGFE